MPPAIGSHVPESAPIPLVPPAASPPPPHGADAALPARDGLGQTRQMAVGKATAALVVIAQDGSPGLRYPLELEQVDVGRTHGDIRLPSDPYVSPRHARLVRRDGRYHVRDLDSVNGVFWRLKRPYLLAHGDLILVGLQVLRFEMVSDVTASYGVATDAGVNRFGSPALPRYARLCQVTVEGIPRNVYYLSTNETLLGRESGDVVFTTDPFMSRSHASLVRNPDTGAFSIRDLGSSNGSYVALRRETTLSDGDFLRIGQHLFRFEIESNEHS